MDEIFMNSDNSKLLSLINDWNNANGKGHTYKNVILELLHGNSTLIVQTFGEQPIETRTFVSDENTNFEFGIYEIEGKEYYGAFTSVDLLNNWIKTPCTYVQLPAKVLIEIADKNEIGGIIINSSYHNMFVAFRN